MAEYVVRVDEKRKPTEHPNDPLPWLLSLPCLEEVIRCRDCKKSRKEGWKCTYWALGRWDEEQEADVIELADVEPDGFCFKAERRES